MPVKKIAIGLYHYHRRLWLAMIVGVVVGLLLPGRWDGIERPLIGWNAFLWCYLLALWIMMFRLPSLKVREVANREDESAATVLFAVVLVTLASLAAIVLVLATTKGAGTNAQKGLHIIFPALTLIGGWLLLPTVFTIHYARVYYLDGDEHPVLQFPDKDVQPDYWDFAYFSFTIAVASQTSDVAIATSRMRRFVLAQSVLAWFFNLAILGLSINVAAGLLS